jgi:hypothetical protein
MRTFQLHMQPHGPFLPQKYVSWLPKSKLEARAYLAYHPPSRNLRQCVRWIELALAFGPLCKSGVRFLLYKVLASFVHSFIILA